MDCPKCSNTMTFEEIKWPCGEFFCDECNVVYDGERFAIPSTDGVIDYEEKLYEGEGRSDE